MMPENRLRLHLPNKVTKKVTKPGIGVSIALRPEKPALPGFFWASLAAFSALLHFTGLRIGRALHYCS